MILAHQIRPLTDARVSIYTFSLDAPAGAPLGTTKYPHHPIDLLKAPPKTINLTPLDRRILMTLVLNSDRDGRAVVSGAVAFSLVSDMIKTGRCYSDKPQSRPLKMGSPLTAKPTWRTIASDGTYKTTYEIDESGTLLAASPALVLDTETSRCHPLNVGIPDALALRWLCKPAMDAHRAATFIAELAASYPQVSLPPPPNLKHRRITNLAPRPVLAISRESGQPATAPRLLARLTFRYNGCEIAAHTEGETIGYIEADTFITVTRHLQTESEARDRLHALGLRPHHPVVADLFDRETLNGILALTDDTPVTWADLIASRLPELEADGWELRHAPDCRFVRVADDDWYADFTTTARGWLAFESGIRIDGQSINLLPFLHRFLLERRDWPEARITESLQGACIPVPTGTCFALIPGERLLRIIRQLFELYGADALDTDDHIRLGALRAAELAHQLPETSWTPPPQLVNLVQSLSQALTIGSRPAPAGMHAILRPYQETGLGWLRFLADHQIGGILADDMGLGKTLQAIALLQSAKHEGRLDLPALIVAPTSVIPNWGSEIARFAPGLRIGLLHGPERHALWEATGDHDILLTSYTLLWRDAVQAERLAYSFLILDEAQKIKNPKAKISRVAARLNARTRLCLTGTPVENHLGELWSLMHVVMPGFLGPEAVFDNVFRRPIENEGHPVLRDILQRRIAPLVLRRTKAMVAPELPPRTEIVQTVALSDVQRELYQTVRMAMTTRIRKVLAGQGLARSRIIVLDALLKLRQICCDPRLRDAHRHYHIPADSGKLAWLSESVPAMIEEGRRILLFSQFTSMLDLIRAQCTRLRIPFVELRGSTRDRETPVRQFQAGEVPLFLISLKAGGTGINLTAADTVIHYDPWWNPAVEQQATDRAHRIGQDKAVFVYKLVTEGTVEQRILALQERKRGLADIVTATAGDGLAFTRAELDTLLAPLG